MSLAHAILGMLHGRPMTGYDLKTRCFDKSVAHFWPADQAQIYRTLERMHADGWVAFLIEPQEERPNRKVYSLTPAGEAELMRWLREEPLPLAPVRDAFLVQLFFAHLLADEQARTLLTRQRALHVERLAAYEAIPLPPLGTPGVEREHVFARMTLDLGLASEKGALEWIDRCLDHLKKGKERKE